MRSSVLICFFFFTSTATTEIYTLSLHDALPISAATSIERLRNYKLRLETGKFAAIDAAPRSEEHTSELQSPDHLVCRLLLEKKNSTSTNDSVKNGRTRRPHVS